MRLLRGDAFDGLFRSFERTAFHLEIRDVHHSPEEAAPFQRPWLELVRDLTDSGRSVRRLRVIPVPHPDHTRWLLSTAGANVEAGEEIRWLPRPAAEPGGAADDFRRDDFWLFDDRRVVFVLFTPAGVFAGGAVTEDPGIVRHCVRARTTLWAAGVPHDDYVKA
ncbi:DUF6879 family protein [Actinoplanes utahensis]|uniref:DUF6879 domain-containing protein n=1 Tax=Actinoplanes utahensis TaxID=1869 RepID=A0A0A6UNN3_ACTUT|nr:DUF6879 family protein [Actinoplanes utahensis]KHD76688.1 hypothetical protein MB27_15470 [Actinoplanes utahensis]GIF33257.1 hypothetical protein Aut01nite_62430 [Actinoplanes utahensis]